MKSQNNFSAIQFATFGLVASLLLIGVALAAPIYRGSFALPFDARWGSTTLPAGDYMLRFEDVGSRAFLVVKETKSGRDVAFLSPVATNETTSTGQSALLETHPESPPGRRRASEPQRPSQEKTGPLREKS
jgi:hypothetical protein